MQSKSIWSLGIQFIVQATFNFLAIFLIIWELLTFGAAANQVDDLFKSEVMEVRMDCVQLRIAANLK